MLLLVSKRFWQFDNKEITEAEILSMFGPSEIGIIHENLLSEEKEVAVERYYECYEEKHHDYVERNHEIVDLLIHLKTRVSVSYRNWKSKKKPGHFSKALGLVSFFDCIVAGDDVMKPKPDPEGILLVLNTLHVNANEAIFIGDSDADILAGKQADVRTIGVQWLPNYQSATFTVQPDYFIKKTDDFLISLNTTFSK